MRLKFAIFSTLMCLSVAMTAQIRFGFKTGLNFSQLKGPAELDANSKSLETINNTTGFHIGMTFGYKFIDHFGVRGEFVYSKKGMKYNYEGPAYKLFFESNVNKLVTGSGKYLVNVNNSYFDLPVMFYGKWRDFEISAGAYASILIQTIGEGAFTLSNGVSPLNNKVADIQFNLIHNYRRDDPGGSAQGENLIVKVDANNLEIPKTIGAYYELKEDKGSLYNSFDFGLVGGLSYYLSSSLYLGARLQYGLADITNNNADVAKSVSDKGAPIFRNDKDRNFTIQASVGFSF
jgi:hypothetical protein